LIEKHPTGSSVRNIVKHAHKNGRLERDLELRELVEAVENLMYKAFEPMETPRAYSNLQCVHANLKPLDND
jgi:hypothetical protein